MSKELITIYKCDRCGKQMESQYAILTLKHAGDSLGDGDYVNKDLCVDCYDKISRLMDDDKAMIVVTENLGDWITVKDSGVKDVSPLETGIYAAWTGVDPLSRQSGTWKTEPLNKHLDVTCV